MTAEDIHARVTAWALEEAGRQCLGEDYGVAVTWGPQPAQGPSGPVPLPVWLLLLTTPSPLLGDTPLYHMVLLPGVRPDETTLRAEVAKGIRELRDLRSRKLATGNGHPALPGARGIAGR